jgi:hypothetical protein
MYPIRKGAKIAHALHLVIRQLDVEMIFEASEQLQSLKAVDAELLEEVILWGEAIDWNLEVSRRQSQDFA